MSQLLRWHQQHSARIGNGRWAFEAEPTNAQQRAGDVVRKCWHTLVDEAGGAAKRSPSEQAETGINAKRCGRPTPKSPVTSSRMHQAAGRPGNVPRSGRAPGPTPHHSPGPGRRQARCVADGRIG